MNKFLCVLAVAVWPALTSAIRVACPADHYCLPGLLCPDGKVAGATPTGQTFMCGLLINTENYVCCSSQEKLPNKFEPNPREWYYGFEHTDEGDDLHVQVVPWLGFGTTPLSEDTAVSPRSSQSEQDLQDEVHVLCPADSYCIHSFLCPPIHIFYSANVFSTANMKSYQCGNTIETSEYVCCNAQVLVSAMHMIVRKYEEKHVDTFITVKMGQSFLKLNKEQESDLYKHRLTTRKDPKPEEADSEESEETDGSSQETDPESAAEPPNIDAEQDDSVAEESADGEVLAGNRRKRRSASEGVYRYSGN